MKAPTPFFVIVIAIAVSAFNLVTLGIPAASDPAAYLVGYLGTPLLLVLLYTVWYRRRHPAG